MLRVEFCRSGVTHRLQTTLIVESVNTNAGQFLVALHPFNIDKVIPVFRPQTLLGGKQRAAIHRLRTIVTRHLLALRGDPFADRHGQQHQGDSRFHHRQRHLHTGEARCLHHHQFATLRQHPQSQQRAKQRRHRKEDLDILRYAEQGVHTRAQRVVVTLPRFFQLIDKLDDPGERHQHEQRHHDGGKNGFTDIAVKYTKWLHYTAPLRRKRARRRRTGTVSHRFKPIANAR